LSTADPVAVSGSATPAALERRTGENAEGTRGTGAPAAIHQALTAFTRATYGSERVSDETLDAAFEAGRKAVQSAAGERRWPARALRTTRSTLRWRSSQRSRSTQT
jgi:hypothetical protein